MIASRLPVVVIVEDDRELADIYQEWLESSYTVRTAYTAEEARTVIGDDVDVVLLDRRLGDASGGEILDWIKGQEFDPRVAMITGVAPDFDVIEMGFDTYAVKPVSRSELREIVQDLLTRIIYDKRIQNYFELRSKKQVLETEKSSDELEESENYARLSGQLDELRAELDYLLQNLDDDYFASEMRQLVDGRQNGFQ